MSLTFNAKNHQYRLDGKHIDGVTTLIKGGLPAPALTYWAARTVAEYVADNDAAVEQLRGMGRNSMVAALKEVPWTARDQAAVKGTDVHELGSRLVHGEAVDVPEHLAGHVEAYVDFLDTWKPKPLVVERPVYSRKWHYAGTPDLIVELPEDLAAAAPDLGPRPLLDLKTGSGIYPDHVYQLSAYRYAEKWVAEDGTEHDVADLGITGAAIVHVSADGWELVPLAADEAAFKTFLHIAYTARAAKKGKELIGLPMARPSTDEALGATA